MARLRQMQIDVEAAKKLLGPQWLINDAELPMAYLPKAGEDFIAVDAFDTEGCRRKLCVWPEMSAGNAVLEQHGVIFEMLWPRNLRCEVDLTKFHWNNKIKPQHPLNGFYIPELVEATKLPFHFPERVRVIPIRFEFDMSRVQVETDKPDGAIFVECWSHYDEYDKHKYRNAYAAFRFVSSLYHGMIENSIFENKELHIGCNFIILPMGYEYVAELENGIRIGNYPKREKLYTENTPKWLEILKKFFDGDDMETENATEVSATTTPMTPTVSATDEAVAEALADFDDVGDSDGADYADDSMSGKGDTEENTSGRMIDDDADLTQDPAFAQWLQDRQTKWRDIFYSDLIQNMLKSCSAFLSETDHGVQLYTVADTDVSYDDRGTYMNRNFKRIGDVWYQIEDFTYCQKHYLALLKRLNKLQSEWDQADRDIQAFHEALAKVQDTIENK